MAEVELGFGGMGGERWRVFLQSSTVASCFHQGLEGLGNWLIYKTKRYNVLNVNVIMLSAKPNAHGIFSPRS